MLASEFEDTHILGVILFEDLDIIGDGHFSVVAVHNSFGLDPGNILIDGAQIDNLGGIGGMGTKFMTVWPLVSN